MEAEPPAIGDDKTISRREFLKSLGRLGGLGLLAGTAAFIGFKSADGPTRRASPEPARRPDPAELCANEGWCRPCPQATDCGLPRALNFRQRSGGGS
jgi:hypothetical protein